MFVACLLVSFVARLHPRRFWRCASATPLFCVARSFSERCVINCMKNKSFYFVDKILASPTSFYPQNKTVEDLLRQSSVEQCKRFNTWRFSDALSTAEVRMMGRGKSTSIKMKQPQGVSYLQTLTIKVQVSMFSSTMSVGSLERSKGSILHKTGYNYGIDGASKYYNPFYVTYRGKGSQ